jgi:hypothetical protein
MKADEDKRAVRPTLRCLIEDLQPDVEPAAVRNAIRALPTELAADPIYLLSASLIDVSHPALVKANMLASSDSARRERIAVVTDRHVVKVKTGDHRAALWRDEAGTWWLLAAGHRRNDDPDDFYRAMERFSKDSSPIAPTTADQQYRSLEEAYAQECEEERAAQVAMIGALLQAALSPGTGMALEIFGALITVTITGDERDDAVLDVAWTFAQFDQQDRFPIDVLAMIPGHEDISGWDFLPAPESGNAPASWYTYVNTSWVEQLATSAELDDLLPDGTDSGPLDPSSDGSEHFSHYAKGAVVTLAYVTGIQIVGICGASVVAHRDYERFPICPTCQENLELLRAMRKTGKD